MKLLIKQRNDYRWLSSLLTFETISLVCSCLSVSLISFLDLAFLHLFAAPKGKVSWVGPGTPLS